MFYKIILLLATVFIVSCTSDRAKTSTFMEILGSDVGSDASAYKVHRDFTVSSLRVRVRSRSESQQQCSSGGIYIIEIDGPINKDTTFVLDKIFTDFPHCTVEGGKKRRGSHAVYLNSSGGTLEDGFAMGRLFRKNAVATILVSKQVCASACAVAFLGGYVRDMKHDAQLIFHAPYTKNYDSIYGNIKCVNSKEAQPLLEYYVEMLGANGVSKKLFERTMDYCSKSDGWTLDSGAADFFGVIK